MSTPFGRRAGAIVLSLVVALWAAPAADGQADGRTAPSSPADTELRDYLAANGLLNRGLYELAAAEYRKFLSAHGSHEKAPVARYGLAVCLFRTQQFEATVPELASLAKLADFAFAAEVGTLLGQSQLALQRYGPAADAFERVVRDFGQHDLADDAAAGAVEALYSAGKHEDVGQRSRTFAERWPESPLGDRVEFFAGSALMARKEYEPAAGRFASLLRDHSESPLAAQAGLLLAQCYQFSGSADAAITQFRKIADQQDHPHVSEALFGLGTLLLEKGQAKAAGAALDRLLESSPQSPLVSAARLQRGRAWFDEAQFDRGLATFAQVGNEGDLADDAAYWAAKCRLRQEKFADAAQRLADAIQRFPDSELKAEMSYDRTVALTRAGQHDAALVSLTDFQKHYPQHALSAGALQLLAVSEHQQRRYDESAEHCRRFLSQFPEHELAASVAFLLGENLYLAGKHADAADAFARFLEQYQKDAQADRARLRLGLALHRTGRLEDAIDALTQVAGLAAKDELYRPALLALGDAHFQRSEWKAAARRLSDYLGLAQDPPSADDALLKLGLAQQRQEQFAEALKTFDQLIERFPQSPQRLQAMFERGQTLVALTRLDAAAQAFENVLKEGAASRFAAHAWNHLAALAAQRKDFAAAAEQFGRVSEMATDSPMAPEAAFGQAEALLAGEKFAEAGAAFTRFIERFPSDARVPRARVQLALSLARQNRCPDALKVIEQVDQAGTQELPEALAAAARYEQAWCLRSLGRNDEAAAAYRKLLDKAAASEFGVHAMLDLAAIEADAKRFESAEALLEQLRTRIERDDKVSREVREQSAYRLSVCAYERGRDAEAGEYFEQFIANFSDSTLLPSAGYFCGEAFFKANRHEKAIVHFARVSEQYPSDAVAGPSLLRLGECQAALQRWSASERSFAEYLDRFSTSDQAFQAQFGVGWACENQNRYDEAVAAYQKVVSAHQGPTAARAQFQIGECLFAQEKYEEATRELLKVDILYAYPEWSAAALYEAGRCFEKLSKPSEALAQFKAVVEKHPKTRWAELAAPKLR